MGGGGHAVDATTGNLLPKLVNIAWPAILQAILANCYAFNDYVFIGHIPDENASKAGTAALSATIGLQVISFALQNMIPSGANTYCSQYRGAGDNVQLGATFRSGFYACLVISTLTAIIGYSNIRAFAGLCNASREVEDAIVLYFGTLLLASPAFSMLLLVDGFYKSCGDTITPLRLEVFSLLLNTLLNFIMVVQLNWGVQGAALATVLSRFVPALVGMIGILRGYLGVDVSLNPFSSDVATVGQATNTSISAASGSSIELTPYASVPVDEENVPSSSLDQSKHSDSTEISIDNDNRSKDGDLLLQESKLIVLPASVVRVLCMLKIGVSQSISDCIYGVVFTIMIRLAGELGESQQAAYGASMRGLEWIAYCAGEGFLAASMTAVGQCIGAGQFERAMHAAIMSAALSAAATGLMGVPFIICPEKFAPLITRDAEVIRYTSQYLRILGCVMSTVGIEMACYGAMLGAGQAGKIVLINGSMNLCRVPLAVLCLYGAARFWPAFAWAVGFGSSSQDYLSQEYNGNDFNTTSFGTRDLLEQQPSSFAVLSSTSNVGPPSGTFSCICWVVAGTASMKAVVYTAWLGYRMVTKSFFADSRVIS